MQVAKPFVITAFIFGLLGCGVISSSDDEVERTYPEAFSFETVTIQQLLYEVETPDSLNINAYVIVISECPESANCFLPDRIGASENLPPADTLYIQAIKPGQFQKQKRYTISLEVTESEGRERHDIRLLGYSLIE